MGALAGVRLDAAEQARAVAAAAGRPRGGRSAVAVAQRRPGPWSPYGCARSCPATPACPPELCAWLATLLADDLVPAVPRRRSGCGRRDHPARPRLGPPGRGRAGCWTPTGRRRGRRPLLAGPATAAARRQGGRRAAPGRARRHGAGAAPGQPRPRVLLRQWTVVAAAEIVARRRLPRPLPAPRPPAATTSSPSSSHELRGPARARSPARRCTCRRPCPSGWSVPMLGHLARSVATLEDAVDRALAGVTDSPAWLDDGAGGRFVGTAGFHGLDLAAACDGVRVALRPRRRGRRGPAAPAARPRVHRAARPAQRRSRTAGRPGRRPQDAPSAPCTRSPAGVHRRRHPRDVARPGGRADLRPGGGRAAAAAPCVAAREVVACELLAVHQARAARPGPAAGSAELSDALARAGDVLPGSHRRPALGRGHRGADLAAGRRLAGLTQASSSSAAAERISGPRTWSSRTSAARRRRGRRGRAPGSRAPARGPAAAPGRRRPARKPAAVAVRRSSSRAARAPWVERLACSSRPSGQHGRRWWSARRAAVRR